MCKKILTFPHKQHTQTQTQSHTQNVQQQPEAKLLYQIPSLYLFIYLLFFYFARLYFLFIIITK